MDLILRSPPLRSFSRLPLSRLPCFSLPLADRESVPHVAPTTLLRFAHAHAHLVSFLSSTEFAYSTINDRVISSPYTSANGEFLFLACESIGRPTYSQCKHSWGATLTLVYLTQVRGSIFTPLGDVCK